MRGRIKALLPKHEGWTDRQIAQALRLHEETVRQHLQEWQNEQKPSPANGGSQSKSTQADIRILKTHPETHIYYASQEVCVYVAKTFGVAYDSVGHDEMVTQAWLSLQTAETCSSQTRRVC